MLPDPEAIGGQAPPSLPIPEIRDYQKINAELVALLDEGHRLVRLEGAEGELVGNRVGDVQLAVRRRVDSLRVLRAVLDAAVLG